MKSKVTVPIILLIGLLLYVVLFRNTSERVSMLLVNGVVYTVNQKQPVAEAVAILGDKIMGVGSNQAMKSSFTAEQTIDLQGKAVFPGFIDSHAHLEGLGAFLMNLNLDGTNSIAEVQELVSRRVKATKPGSWIRGRGWDQNKWPKKAFPVHEDLDNVTSEAPIYLTRVDGHAVWVNKKVLDLAQITNATPDPEGGKIVRDQLGNPTGVFVDNAVDVLNTVLPPVSEQERTEAIERAMTECIKTGLTGVHDMGVDLSGIEICKKLIRARKFPLRVYAAIGGVGETWDHYLKSGPDIGANGLRLTVRALKLYADGALGSRGAALIEPYSDDPINRGLTLTSAEVMRTVAREALEHGFQLCTHAIGDRANYIVLNVYEEVFKADPSRAKDARFRIEHAQVLDSSDVPRFHRLGVLPMMQPTHCTSDMRWAERRLGPRRIAGAYAWRSLINQGSIIPGGSDFPVESPNPLWGFYAAITRQNRDGWPDGGWYPEQRMTRDEALKAFTLWGAYAGFEENIKGSIEPGKLADVTVLSRDIMKVAPASILETVVDMTMVGGEIVYTRAAATH